MAISFGPNVGIRRRPAGFAEEFETSINEGLPGGTSGQLVPTGSQDIDFFGLESEFLGGQGGGGGGFAPPPSGFGGGGAFSAALANRPRFESRFLPLLLQAINEEPGANLTGTQENLLRGVRSRTQGANALRGLGASTDVALASAIAPSLESFQRSRIGELIGGLQAETRLGLGSERLDLEALLGGRGLDLQEQLGLSRLDLERLLGISGLGVQERGQDINLLIAQLAQSGQI